MLDDHESFGAIVGAESPDALAFTVRTSTRARRIRLTVTAREGLVVIVPQRWRGDATAIVAGKRAWAERALASVAERRGRFLAGAEALLPDIVELPALGIALPVEYRSSASATVRASTQGPILAVVGDTGDADKCIAALRRWLMRVAREELPGLMASESARTGLTPTRFRVTSAKTRWGSCSARGTVSLNRNSLFLPEHLARALVLHELAHLRVLDHSPRFWSLLATLDPHALEHRAQLRKAGGLVPPWADD